MTDWDSLRSDVPGLASTCYLNSCSMGLPDQSTLDALGAYGSQWSTRGASSWANHWMPALEEWRKVMARLIGARPEEVAWAPSVGAALGTLGSALLRQRLEAASSTSRNEIVLGELEFPAAYAALGQRSGTVTRWAAADSENPGLIPLANYVNALGPQTEAIVASRVLFSTGALQDIKYLSTAARKAGALMILDDYQALGQRILDVVEMGTDIAVGGALKWMCGGVGSAWMYVRKDLHAQLSPMHYGWWANSKMFEFTPQFTPWDDARRFEGGEVNMAGLLTSLAAARRMADIGPQAIETRVTELARDLRERLLDKRISTSSLPPELQTAIVTIPRPKAAADTVRLEKRGIIVDSRAGKLRVSPHYYNTFEDNEEFVRNLATP